MFADFGIGLVMMSCARCLDRRIGMRQLPQPDEHPQIENDSDGDRGVVTLLLTVPQNSLVPDSQELLRQDDSFVVPSTRTR